MGTPPRETKFSAWLSEQIDRREMSVRGLARVIATRHPQGATVRNIETVRRQLNKYLLEGRLPAEAMRRAIAEALGVDPSEMPAADDEEEHPVLTLLARTRADLERIENVFRQLPLMAGLPGGRDAAAPARERGEERVA